MKTFREISESNHVSVTSLDKIQARDGIPGTEWKRIEKSADEFSDQFKPKWINLENDPEEAGEYLTIVVYNYSQYRMISKYADGIWIDNNGNDITKRVTHFSPMLPLPTKP